MNKSLKGILILLIGMVYLNTVSLAQDAQFSQYYASGLYLNPALVGSENELTFKSNYRTQWRSITLPYVTSQVSLIYPINNHGPDGKHVGGGGISFYNDKAGDGNLKVLGVSFSGAYTLHLGTGTSDVLSLGLQVGYIQKQLDFTNLEWGNQFNPYLGFDPTLSPNEPNIVPTTRFEDVNAGLVWYHNSARNYEKKKWSGFFGLSAYHLTTPVETIMDNQGTELPMLLKVHSGLEVHMFSRFNIFPNIIYMAQKGNSQINIGGYLDYDLFQRTSHYVSSHMEGILGMWYRVGDSFIFMAGVQNAYYTLGFSFDLNSSQLRTQTRGRGAYEVSLSIRRVREKKRLKFSTPRI